MSTRFNPVNSNKQCEHCNTFMDGREYEYGLALDRKYVVGTAKLIYEESKKDKIWSCAELSTLIEAAKMGYKTYCEVYNQFMPMRKVENKKYKENEHSYLNSDSSVKSSSSSATVAVAKSAK